MREKRYYILSGDKDKIKNILMMVEPNNAPYSASMTALYTDTYNHKLLIELCREYNISFHLLRFEMDYSKNELEHAEYLHLQMRTYCSEFAEDYGTKYDYSEKCKCCGSGKKQVSDLIIDKTKMGKKDISSTYGFEVVISESLYQLLADNGITGFRTGAVKHKNDKMKNEPMLYQLFCTNILPPLNEQSVFYKEKYCERCHRSGLLLKSLAFYDRQSLENAKDFNYTYEYFGGGVSGTPNIIISQKVYRLFRDNKIKGVVFDIINIV